jgi:hypothetical protein
LVEVVEVVSVQPVEAGVEDLVLCKPIQFQLPGEIFILFPPVREVTDALAVPVVELLF